MQVQSINNQRSNMSFKKITVCGEGLYKKRPDLVKELLDTFMSNPKAIEFSKKRKDLDIVFFAAKAAQGAVENSINIIYKNPVMGAIGRFFNSIGMYNPTKVLKIPGFSRSYNPDESLQSATEDLKIQMMPSTLGFPTTGVLDSHIDLHEKEIEKFFEAKTEKKSQEAARKSALHSKKEKLDIDNSLLNQSIKELNEMVK